MKMGGGCKMENKKRFISVKTLCFYLRRMERCFHSERGKDKDIHYSGGGRCLILRYFRLWSNLL